MVFALLEYKPLNAARECGVTFFSNMHLSVCTYSVYKHVVPTSQIDNNKIPLTSSSANYLNRLSVHTEIVPDVQRVKGNILPLIGSASSSETYSREAQV
jgi:hypothetical protein